MAQSVKCATSAQVMVSQFVSSSPMSGSVLTAWSLEPALDSVSLPLCPSLALSLKIYKHKTIKKKRMVKIKGEPWWLCQLSIQLQLRS